MGTCTLGFRDLHRPSVTGLTGCLHLVVMIYFWDVEPEGGATAIVPGSHRYEDAARDHGFTHSRLEQDGIVVGAVPAGGAMLFDNRTYHTALPNTNGVDRRSLTIRYIPDLMHAHPVLAQWIAESRWASLSRPRRLLIIYRK